MTPRTHHPDAPDRRLPIGVGPARLGPGGRVVLTGGVADGPGTLPTAAGVVAYERLVGAPEGSRLREPVVVVMTGLARRTWRSVDAPATAQRIAARAGAVVLVTDPAHLRVVAGLASRLVDRGVCCWVAADAGEDYARAAAASGLGWGLTPS